MNLNVYFKDPITIYLVDSGIGNRLDAISQTLTRVEQRIISMNAETTAVLARIDEHTNGLAGDIDTVRTVVSDLRELLKDGITKEEVQATLNPKLDQLDQSLQTASQSLRNVAADPNNPTPTP